MRVLVFRHVPFEGLGRIEPVLRSRGIDIDYADLYRESHLPSASLASGYDGLIFMGGPMSANDPLPYLALETQMIECAAAAGQPVLGICLGAQLIARALGARIYRNPSKEIGWFDIDFTELARQDPLFAGFSGPETVFHWHGETFDLPPGAQLLASSERCRHQAFRVGRGIYGLQFHLEVTPEMAADWCTQDENCGDVRELEGPLDLWQNSERLRHLSEIVFGRWCNLVDTSHSRQGCG